MSFALFDEWPRLAVRVPRAPLGEFPTPVESWASLARASGSAGHELWVKRDDISSRLYGGNKVRTLELLFGKARAESRSRIMATGPFGSNHALATAVHAPRVGLEPEALLFPQPTSRAAYANLRALACPPGGVHALPHWSALPFGMAWFARADRARYVMPPGGATALGALGYVSAGLELGRQIAQHDLPVPRRVVVGVGSTCTAAGLLVGLRLAAHVGSWSSVTTPVLVAVRVSPWPVTSRTRILRLAADISRHLHRESGGQVPLFSVETFGARLHVDGRFLGPGYGFASRAGDEAEAIFRALRLPALDSTYSAKVVAGLLSLMRAGEAGPTLWWSTKSIVPMLASNLPERNLELLPRAMRQWLHRAEGALHGSPTSG